MAVKTLPLIMKIIPLFKYFSHLFSVSFDEDDKRASGITENCRD